MVRRLVTNSLRRRAWRLGVWAGDRRGTLMEFEGWSWTGGVSAFEEVAETPFEADGCDRRSVSLL